MKSAISKLVCAALLGAGMATVPMAGTAQAQNVVTYGYHAEIVPVHDRRWHRRHWHHRRGGSVQFNFGNGSVWIEVPQTHRRYHRRAYRRDYHSLHVDWCYDRYRSYRHWDNTFQPYHGPRRQCVSPYY